MFFFSERAIHFHFRRWMGLIQYFPGLGLAVIALMAKSVIFFRPHRRLISQVITGIFVFSIFVVEMKIWEPNPLIFLALIGIPAIVSVILHFSRHFHPNILSLFPIKERTYLRNVALLTCLSYLYYYLIRVPNEAYQWADLLMAGVFLAALYLKRNHNRHRVQSGYAFLMIISMIAVGWITLAWTVHRLEFFFVFDWFSTGTVTKYVVLFLPFIILRYMIPLIMIRILLTEVFKRSSPFPHRAVLVVAGLKLCSLLLIFYGIGLNNTSNVYYEGVQEAGIWIILILGLL